MKKKLLSGILFSSAGSFWWGVIGVFYFKYVSFAGTVELVVHRTIWTAFVLLLSIIFYSRWDFFFEILNNKKKLFILFISGLLIFINWFTWIYAVVTNRLVDASFGYYIFPILSVLFGFLFFKESYLLKNAEENISHLTNESSEVYTEFSNFLEEFIKF